MPHYVGSRSPEGVTLTVRTTAGFDLSAVTSGEITVRAPSGHYLTWDWTLQSAQEHAAVFFHEYAADGSDVRHAGEYAFGGWVITSTTRRRIHSVSVTYERYP